MNIFQPIRILALLLLGYSYPILSIPVYNQGFQNPVSIGSGALGVGMSNPVSGLYNNPGYLRKQNQSLFDIGLQGSVYGEQIPPVNPGGAGGYYSLDESNWAFYGVYSTMYSKFLPDRQNVHLNHAHLGLSYRWSDDFFISMSLGPSLVHRYRTLSNWSLSGKLNLLYSWGDFNFGAMLEVPGRFSREDYRGGDELLETAPERLSIGVEYKIWENVGIYGEARRIFWERSEFILNGINETPDFERGIGAEYSFSGSLYWEDILGSNWQVRSGIDYGGVYNDTGKNLRSLGIALGWGYSWKWKESREKERAVILQFGLIDYTITSTKKNRNPETIYSFSISYLSF